MARLRNIKSGAIVNVPDEKAIRLGSEWEPADGSERTPARSETPDKSWKVDELKAYADDNSIDLGDATKKDDVIAAIELHNEALEA